MKTTFITTAVTSLCLAYSASSQTVSSNYVGFYDIPITETIFDDGNPLPANFISVSSPVGFDYATNQASVDFAPDGTDSLLTWNTFGWDVAQYYGFYDNGGIFWVDSSNQPAPFHAQPGQGVAGWKTSADKITVVGSLAQQIDLPIVGGWNCLGNPLPFPVSMDHLHLAFANTGGDNFLFPGHHYPNVYDTAVFAVPYDLFSEEDWLGWYGALPPTFDGMVWMDSNWEYIISPPVLQPFQMFFHGYDGYGTNWQFSYSIEVAPPANQPQAVWPANSTLTMELIQRPITNILAGLMWNGPIYLQLETNTPYVWFPIDSDVLASTDMEQRNITMGEYYKPQKFLSRGDYALESYYATNNAPVQSVLMPDNTLDFVLTLHGTEAGHNYYVVSKSNITNQYWELEATLPGQADSVTTTVDRNDRDQATLHAFRDDLDSDNDGIPDWWSEVNYGHATGWDTDNSLYYQSYVSDGVSNLQKYREGKSARSSSPLVHVDNPSQTTTLIAIGEMANQLMLGSGYALPNLPMPPQ